MHLDDFGLIFKIYVNYRGPVGALVRANMDPSPSVYHPTPYEGVSGFRSMLQDPLSLALGPFRKDSQGKRPCECAVKTIYQRPGLTSKFGLPCHGVSRKWWKSGDGQGQEPKIVCSDTALQHREAINWG